jgi:hypothetical protein
LPKRILFSGYAPVHVLCFMPAYRLLRDNPEVELWLSGGFQTKTEDGETFSLEGFYDAFDVDRDRIITVEQSRQEDFDVVVCSHLSTNLFPRSATKAVEVFHGVSFKNLMARGTKALDYDLLCVPGNYHAALFQSNGLIQPEGGTQGYVTGFTKLDAFFSGELDRDETLRKVGVDPAMPTLLYTPTGGKKNSLEIMGEEVISLLGQQEGWNLLIKPHDHPKKKIDWFARLAPYESDRVKLVRDWDVVPYLFAADLLISDASSTTTEYTLLDRPIIFLDVPALLGKIVKRGGFLDLDTYGRKIGTRVAAPEEVVACVEDALAHPERESELRMAMAKDVFHDPGHAAERVKEVILFAAGVTVSLPESIRQLEPAAPASV